MADFVGRDHELELLKGLKSKGSASLVVLTGRRRIGKSRLVQEFSKKSTFYRFSGLPPTKETTQKSERDEFSRQLSQQTGLPFVQADDWSQLLLLLAEKVKDKKVVVLFDEISWMASKDPNFLGKLKNAWDMHFSRAC